MAEDLGRLPAGRYRRVGPIGQGGMGAVWRAFDTELNRTLAHSPEMASHALFDQAVHINSSGGRT